MWNKWPKQIGIFFDATSVLTRKHLQFQFIDWFTENCWKKHFSTHKFFQRMWIFISTAAIFIAICYIQLVKNFNGRREFRAKTGFKRMRIDPKQQQVLKLKLFILCIYNLQKTCRFLIFSLAKLVENAFSMHWIWFYFHSLQLITKRDVMAAAAAAAVHWISILVVKQNANNDNEDKMYFYLCAHQSKVLKWWNIFANCKSPFSTFVSQQNFVNCIFTI